MPILLAAAAGCGGSDEPAGGAAPPSYSVAFGPVTVAPGAENTQCIVARLGNPAPIHVGAIHDTLGDASHHLIVYRVSDETERLTPFDCEPFSDTLDPAHGSTLIVSQRRDDLLTLPEGVGYTLDTNQMLRVEMHYINASTEPATLSAKTTMIPIADGTYRDEAGFLFIGDPDISLPPHTQQTLGPVFFEFPGQYSEAKFFAITGHEHRMGTNVLIDAAASADDPGSAVYDVADWSWSEPATVTHATPFQVPKGGGFRFTCEWNNTSDDTVTFGESANDEMCFFWAYYYPSNGSSVCIHSDTDGAHDLCCPGAPECEALFAPKPACNDEANTGAAVAATNVPTAPPTGTSGVIADGTYQLTAVEYFTGDGGASGPTGQMLRATSVLSHGTYQYVNDDSTAPGDVHTGGSFTTEGSTIAAQQDCPTAQALPFTSFTSDGGTLTLYGSAGGTSLAYTYTMK